MSASIRHYSLLLIVWFLVCVFAHDFVSQNINQANQNRIQLIQNKVLDYHWPMQSADEVVASFRAAWQVTQQGLQSGEVDSMAMSVDMAGQWIDPELQQTLLLAIDTGIDALSSAHVKFEFSNQRRQLYYDSPDLSLADWPGVFALNDVLWRANTKRESALDGQFFAWQELAKLDALVIRFSFQSPVSLTVKRVEIRQDQIKQRLVNACYTQLDSDWYCHISNQMNALDDSWHLQGQSWLFSFPVFSDHVPWLWLLAAWVGLLWLLKLSHAQRLGGLMVLVSVLLLAVGILHQSWLSTYFNFLRWPLLLLFLLLVYYQRRYFSLPEKAAWWLWGCSLLLAVLALLLTEAEWSFVYRLPAYFIWAWVQQLIMGPMVTDFIHARLKGSQWMTAALVGVLFSIIHAPNHMLMLATLIGGVVWSYAWLKYKNLYANAFSHAVLALVFYQVMPVAWLGSARIGVFF